MNADNKYIGVMRGVYFDFEYGIDKGTPDAMLVLIGFEVEDSGEFISVEYHFTKNRGQIIFSELEKRLKKSDELKAEIQLDKPIGESMNCNGIGLIKFLDKD